jgi:hypothetical protein
MAQFSIERAIKKFILKSEINKKIQKGTFILAISAAINATLLFIAFQINPLLSYGASFLFSGVFFYLHKVIL